jgi:predicted phage replisome organizer
MAEQKRFYWIKLKENFFDIETIDWLISQKNGCEYIVLYQKLCLLAANKGGRLAMQVGEMIVPYDVNKIARDTKFDIDTVIVAMELFRKIGLIYEESDGVLKIPYVEEIVGSETPAAIKKRKQREKKKLLQGDKQGDKIGDNVLQEKENREKILDNRFSDIEAEEEVNGADAPDYSDPDNQLQIFKGNILLSENQMGELLDLMGLEVFDEYIARLQAFIEARGANIKSHYQTLLKWYNEDRSVKK